MLNFLLWIGISTCFSQQSLVSNGTSTTSGNGEVSVSVGLLTFSNIYSDTYAIEIGMQQSYEISYGFDFKTSDQFQVKIIPNPATDHFNISIESEIQNDYQLDIYDFSGTNHEHINFSSSSIKVPIDQLPPGYYFIVFSCNKQITKEFNLIKL